MNALIDTHVWLWAIGRPAELSTAATSLLVDPDVRLHVSAISFWELALLAERGRIDVDGDLDGWIEFALREFPLVELPITSGIALESRRIELSHGDPADRFLAATSRVHDLTLVTRDAKLIEFEGVATIVA